MEKKNRKEWILEVCAGSYEDCLTAWKAKARRVELNSALSAGGLTPTTAVLRRVKKNTDLEVICMVRPRAAGFCYSETEKETMFEEAQELLAAGADGLAFGFLNENTTVDAIWTKKMCELIHGFGKEKKAVFHRAFDVTEDLNDSARVLIACGVDRILTSGAKATAEEGMEKIRELQEQFGDQIEILAGSGVNAKNARKILEETGISQVHSSCKGYVADPTTAGNEVNYSYLPWPHTMDYDVVDEKLVSRLVQVLEQEERDIQE